MFGKFSGAICAMGVALSSSSVLAQSAVDGPVAQRGANWVSTPIQPEFFHLDLSDRPHADGWKPGDQVREIPRRNYGATYTPPPPNEGQDPLALMQQQYQAGRAPQAFGAIVANLNGLSATGFSPGDPVIDIGTTHAIQAINGTGGTTYAIYDKTGLLVAGPLTLDGLGTGNCANGLGDPIVFFDELARRWLLTEFTDGSNDLCIYVSQYEDPTLPQTWARYSFVPPNFPDYPKYGAWNDAYYLGTNESPGGLALYALNRKAMLEGRTMTTQRFTATKLSGFGFQVAQPVDIDGQFPPDAGSPGIFLRHNDAESHGRGSVAPDWVELFSLSIDWTTPANSVLSGPLQIPVTEFSSNLNGLSAFSAFPQPNGTKLDPLREQVMYRAAYRRFPTHEAIVGNFVTDVDGADTGGVRWFELRRNGGAWTLYQEGTVALGDFIDRWMGASAMDEGGNIALAYSVTRDNDHPAPNNAEVFAGMRYLGRLASDPLSVMTTGEQVLVDGAGSQSGSTRWGDYHAMGVDPADGCTFWVTGQHMPNSNWATRVGAFRHTECTNFGRFGVELKSSTPGQPLSLDVCAGGPSTTAVVDVTAFGGFNGSVDLSVSGLPAGVTSGLSATPVSAPAQSTLTLTASGGATVGKTLFNIDAANGGSTRRIQGVLNVSAAIAGSPSLTAPADAATVALRPALSWSALAGAASYQVEIATDSGFTNIVYSRVVPSNSHTVDTNLQGATQHYWRVAASSPCGAGTISTTRSFTTSADLSQCPIGTTATIVFNDTIEPAQAGWGAAELPAAGAVGWSVTTTRPASPTRAWEGDDAANSTEQRLDTPSIVIPVGATSVIASFSHAYDLEERGTTECWDGAALDLSTNNGSSYAAVADASIVVGGYTRTIRAGTTGNALAGRRAWCATSLTHSQVVANLGAIGGTTAKLRFRLASDNSLAVDGWYVDDVVVKACMPPPPPTTTTLVSSNDPGVYGEGTTLTATVSSGSGTPAGNVEFRDGAAVLGTVALSSGVASLSTSSLTVDTHNLSAVYAGNASHSGSTGIDTHTVNKADTTIALLDDPDPSTQGASVTVTANLAPVFPGAGTPTGSITVTASNSGGCVITVPAQTSCVLTFTASGPQIINASYSGDGNFNGSAAAQIDHQSTSNTAPTIDATAAGTTTIEELATSALGLTLADTESPGALTLSATASTDSTLIPLANVAFGGAGLARNVVFTPAANRFGTSTVTLSVTDAGGLTDSVDVLVTVDPVNDAPSFTTLGNRTHSAGSSGAQSVSGFVSSVDLGPNESGQAVQAYTVAEVGSSGVISAVAIANNGTLSYTLTGTGGTATISATLTDNGGNANGGVDTSTAQQFTIFVGDGADLSVQVDNDASAVLEGSTLTYVVTVANAGPNAVSNAAFSVPAPTGANFGGWSCVGDGSCPVDGFGPINASLDLDAGESLSFEISATVTAVAGQTLTVTANVAAPGGVTDPASDNNADSDADPVVGDAVFDDGFEE